MYADTYIFPYMVIHKIQFWLNCIVKLKVPYLIMQINTKHMNLYSHLNIF